MPYSVMKVLLSAHHAYGLLNTLMNLLDRPNLNCVNIGTKFK